MFRAETKARHPAQNSERIFVQGDEKRNAAPKEKINLKKHFTTREILCIIIMNIQEEVHCRWL